VNYPLALDNGLPASMTSQPVISTSVNSGSSCPVTVYKIPARKPMVFRLWDEGIIPGKTTLKNIVF